MRFNTAAPTRHKTVNLAGGEAFVQDPRMELASLLLTSFVQDQFYRKADDQIARVRALIASRPDMPMFAAQAAILARNEFGMRSISHVVAGEIAARVKGEPWTRRFLAKVARRPDDVTEIMSYFLASHKGKGKPTNALKKGLGDALARFDAYQLGKYKNERAALSLVDAVNLCHPPHTDAIAALVNGTLTPPGTWEVRLTQAGSDPDAKRQAWTDLVTTRKLGYFALLRNLRNIMEQAPDTLPAALEMLTDEALIRKSLVLPFRFTTAVDEIGKVPGSREVIRGLARALDMSTQNVPHMEGKTLVAVDVSGSMMGGYGSALGSKSPIRIASLFAAVLAKANDADVLLFENSAQYLGVNPDDATLSIAGVIEKAATGGGTNFHAIFGAAVRPYDRIIILSDMQGWVGYNAPTTSLSQYEARTGARPHVFSFDLQGHGTMQLPQDRLYCLAGFSEKVFDVMALLEEDRQALVRRIEAVEL
jgi:60 kDa SS-A/Ro ribonucleoprotein